MYTGSNAHQPKYQQSTNDSTYLQNVETSNNCGRISLWFNCYKGTDHQSVHNLGTLIESRTMAAIIVNIQNPGTAVDHVEQTGVGFPFQTDASFR